MSWRVYGGIALVLALTLAAPASATHDTTRYTDAPYFDLAARWAPVFGQDTASKYTEDYITRFDFDHDWVGNNNWDNTYLYEQNAALYALKAWIYYSVVETDSHWYIHYYAFHPRDWNNVWFGGCGPDPDCHENDGEGVLLVVQKDGTPYGRVQVVETLAHDEFYQYTDDASIKSGTDNVDGGIVYDSTTGTPVVYVESKGHGICGWDSPSTVKCSHSKNDDFPGGDGLFYRYKGVAELPEHKNDRDVGYDLLPMSLLWDRRADIGNGRTFDCPFSYAGARHSIPGTIGGCLDGDTKGDDQAKPPWGWDDSNDGPVYKGDWFFDPAHAVSTHLDIPVTSPLVTPTAADQDGDTLDDAKEQALLEQFKPTWHFHRKDKAKGPVQLQKGTTDPVVVDGSEGYIYAWARPSPGGCPPAAADAGMCSQAAVSVELKFIPIWEWDYGLPPTFNWPWCIPGITFHKWDREGGVRLLVSGPSWDAAPDQWRIWRIAYHHHGDLDEYPGLPGIGSNTGESVSAYTSWNKHGTYPSVETARNEDSAAFCDIADEGAPAHRDYTPDNLGEFGRPMNNNLFGGFYNNGKNRLEPAMGVFSTTYVDNPYLSITPDPPVVDPEAPPAPTLGSPEFLDPALQISADIRARHMPFGTIHDPVYDSPTGNTIVGYARCGDSAIWTGHYLAAESYRYSVTRDAEALANVRSALSGLHNLLEITGGEGLLARCMIRADSPYLAGELAAEAHNRPTLASLNGVDYYWFDHVSRDQYTGAMFGFMTAWRLVDAPDVRDTAAADITRMVDFLVRNNWVVPYPDGRPSLVLFWGRFDQQLAFLQMARTVNPAKFQSKYDSMAALSSKLVSAPIWFETLDTHNSYYKFNLDYDNLFHLVLLEDDAARKADYMKAYTTLRKATESHGNAHFNMIDRALRGPEAGRDAETQQLLADWLTRPRRDVWVDLSGSVPVCGGKACSPVPVAQRVNTDFLWQRSPFQLAGGGAGTIESPGIDYILPYWMARHYLEPWESETTASPAGPEADVTTLFAEAEPAATLDGILTGNFHEDSVSADQLWDIPLAGVPFLNVGAGVKVTAKNVEGEWGQWFVRIAADRVEVTPVAGAGVPGFRIVEINGGVALVVTDPSAEIAIESGNLVYQASFSSLDAGTRDVVIQLFGKEVYRIDIPDWSYHLLDGRQVRGVLGLSTSIRPTSLNLDASGLNLSWPAVPGAAQYSIVEATNKFNTAVAKVVNTTRTFFQDLADDAGQVFYWIRPVDADGTVAPTTSVVSKVKKTFTYQPGKTNLFWVSIPHGSKFARASDIVAALEPEGGNSKVS
ncbi:MAG: hypothetical protein QXT68_10055, partial [Halobacteria archaeon]